MVLTLAISAGRIRKSEGLVLKICSVLAIDIGLYFSSPDVAQSVGASGVLHGPFLGIAVILASRSRDPVGVLLLLFIVIKLAAEWPAGGTLIISVTDEFRVVTEAHRYGAAGGLAGALATLSGALGKQWRASVSRRSD